MVVTLKAIYQDGVFKPLDTPDLPNNQEVELAIIWPVSSSASEVSTPLTALRGIWSHVSDEDLDRLEAALNQMRQQTAAKVERLIHELDETHHE
jgi:predicted DNA-binding antitoxin AbrB/MazE fold protein